MVIATVSITTSMITATNPASVSIVLPLPVLLPFAFPSLPFLYPLLRHLDSGVVFSVSHSLSTPTPSPLVKVEHCHADNSDSAITAPPQAHACQWYSSILDRIGGKKEN
eukprot:m.60746 g.60746  ORF g.60746 m.60746 type:complete len:109 (-) comp17480_c0_seq2:66-392(-)